MPFLFNITLKVPENTIRQKTKLYGSKRKKQNCVMI